MTVSTTSIVRPRRVERRLGGRIFRSPTAAISLLWLVGLLVASLTSPLWLRYGPLEQDLTAVLQGPSLAHYLGTDELGRDLLSRLVTAAVNQLHRTGGRYALCTMCIGVGQGIALIVERV